LWDRGGWLDLTQRLLSRIAIFACGTVFLLAALWLVAGLAALAWVMWETRPPSQMQFDSARWKDPGENDELRWRMHKDLINEYGLVGVTEDEVIALLGYDCGCSYFREYDLVYWMGPEQNPCSGSTAFGSLSGSATMAV
jgi:hypothetical protein